MSTPNSVTVSQVSDVTTVELTTQGPQGPAFATTGTTLDVRNDGKGDLLTLRATTTEVFNVSSSGDMTIAGNVSGSSTSTGSFGRVQATKVYAGDNNITTDSLSIQTTSRFFGVSGNSINMTANGSSITSGNYNIIVVDYII